MPTRKRIVVEGYGPLATGPHQVTNWDDVWISWKRRPGRPRTQLAPTLVGFAEFRAQEELSRQDPADQGSVESNARIRRELEAAPASVVIDEVEPPNVYTRAETIDRAEAERMLACLMERRYGIRHPKFRWQRRGRDGFALVPVTIL
jgi:hypothetical protein